MSIKIESIKIPKEIVMEIIDGPQMSRSQENNQKDFTAYLKDGNKYQPIKESMDSLPSAYYTPIYDDYRDYVALQKKIVTIPNLYKLDNPSQELILKDIEKFWESEEIYRRFGSVYKRNILLYSAPGNGKTSIINLICKIIMEKYNGIVICIDEHRDLVAYKKCMERVRSVEPNRKVLTLIEDFERLATNDNTTSAVLQLLDGNAQFDNVVTICTTNYPETLDKRFVTRPSRFNLMIEFKAPSDIVRKQYIENKLRDGGFDLNNEGLKATINRYVEKTKGFSLDFVKEVVQSIFIDRISEDETFARIDKILKNGGKIKLSEESKSIGFNKDDYVDEEELIDACCNDDMEMDIPIKPLSND